MQTVWTALPEFHHIWYHSVTSPVWRQWNWLVAKALDHFRQARVQYAASIEHFALARRPSSELAAEGTGMKVTLRFFPRSFFRFPADAHLSVPFTPIKCESRVRIGFELSAFFAFVIREKHEALLIESLQQDDSDRWFSVAPGGGETHGVDITNLSFDCRSEPV